MEQRGPSAYIAELVGTFVLVLFIALIVSIVARPGSTFAVFAVVGLLHAFVLMMLIQTLGGTSGGHFNPAVTLGLMAVRKIQAQAAAGYVLMQLIGAIAGAALCKLMLSEMLLKPSLGNPAVSSLLGGKTLLGALCELTGTFVLVWSVAGVAVNPRGARDWAGFVIGATLGFAVMTFAPLTGAGLNPARSLGPAIVAGHFSGGFGSFLVVYVIGPIIGGVLATLGYKALVLDPQEKVGERPLDKLS
jgi:MIP family channel proteins